MEILWATILVFSFPLHSASSHPATAEAPSCEHVANLTSQYLFLAVSEDSLAYWQSLSRYATGIDVFDPPQLEAAVCYIYDIRSYEDLVDRVYDQTKLANIGRFAYDYATIHLQQRYAGPNIFTRRKFAALGILEQEQNFATAATHLQDVIDGLGLFDLDPLGVEYVEQLNSVLDILPGSRREVVATPIPEDERFSRLRDAAAELMEAVQAKYEAAGWENIRELARWYSEGMVELDNAQWVDQFVRNISEVHLLYELNDHLMPYLHGTLPRLIWLGVERFYSVAGHLNFGRTRLTSTSSDNPKVLAVIEYRLALLAMWDAWRQSGLLRLPVSHRHSTLARV